jgi:DNA-binding NarL/FixJ family response regulator/two-component sensor histidine kinase
MNMWRRQSGARGASDGLARVEREYACLFAELEATQRRYQGLARAVWRVQEDERRRLARELHDELGQLLTALIHRLDRADDRADDGAGQSGVELAREALGRVRELARMLRPPVLDDLGLAAALNWLARQAREHAELRVTVTTPAAFARVDSDLETLVYRVAQEALTNAIRHAGARRAAIELERVGNQLELRIRDDGRGFDPESARQGGAQGTGLGGMRDRVALFGGTPGRPVRARPRHGDRRHPGAAGSRPPGTDGSMKPVRVLLADDHTVVREGLVALLQGDGRCEVVAQAGDGIEAVDRASACRPDVAIVDLSMPRLPGIDVVQRIHKALPATRILVLTYHDEEEYVLPLVRAGASGYLVKDAASTDLLRAVEALAAGQAWFGPQAARVLADAQRRSATSADDDPYERLTPREREVMRLVCDGHSTKAVARLLEISVKTAENHRSRVLDKLAVSNTAELVRFAARRGLVD